MARLVQRVAWLLIDPLLAQCSIAVSPQLPFFLFITLNNDITVVIHRQIIKNYQLQDASSLSFTFLMTWLIGMCALYFKE